MGNTVSIHTPTQGVTTDAISARKSGGCFNPHTHAGCDFMWCTKVIIKIGFNPHTHAGCDSIRICPVAGCPVSIHTPTQGVTPSQDVTGCCLTVSIHTPTQGVTQRTGRRGPLRAVSIHTPTQGVTAHIWRPWTPCPCFNPHTHAGCDSISNNIL